MSKSRLAILLILTLCLVLVPACKKKQPEPVPEPEQETMTPPPPAEKPDVEVKEDNIPTEKPMDREPVVTVDTIQAQLRTIYFDFDKFDLSESARGNLRHNSQVLKDNGEFNVVIEGHCDERGSIEYNLALGERRANATRDYLVTLGVAASRVRIVSYGEERPADRGHGEAAWAKNRRAEFAVETR